MLNQKERGKNRKQNRKANRTQIYYGTCRPKHINKYIKF